MRPMNTTWRWCLREPGIFVTDAPSNTVDVHVLLPLASMASGDFRYGESHQSHAPGTTVAATSCCLNFPALLAPGGPARTTRHFPVARPSPTLRAAFGVQISSPCRFSRASLRSDMRALLPLGAAMLGVAQRRGKTSTSCRPSMACLALEPPMAAAPVHIVTANLP